MSSLERAKLEGCGIWADEREAAILAATLGCKTEWVLVVFNL
jgi:hypothetical protein